MSGFVARPYSATDARAECAPLQPSRPFGLPPDEGRQTRGLAQHLHGRSAVALLACAVVVGVISHAETVVIPQAVVGGDEAIRVATDYVQTEWKKASVDQAFGIDEVQHRHSLNGEHVRLQQTLHGVPVFDHDVTVTLSPQGAVRFTFGHVRTDRTAPASTPWLKSEGEALWLASAAARVRGELRDESSVRRVFFVSAGGSLVTAWEVTLPAHDPFGTWQVVIADADGKVLLLEDVLARDHPITVGRVFDPNPVVTAGGNVIPGNPATVVDCDSPDPAEAALFAAEYEDRPLLGINPGQGKLKGRYVEVLDEVADELAHTYLYTCDDTRFEEVMVYYHIDRAQRVVQSLGFSGLSGIHERPVPVVAHAGDGCISFFHSGTIFMSDGGICGGRPVLSDHAEDADVIVHEYGHAIQFDQGIPGTSAISEGFADFFAASIFNDPCMYEWRAAVGYPDLVCARRLDTGQFYDAYVTGEMRFHRYYPEDMYGDAHGQGLVLFGALWDAGTALGGDTPARHKILKLALQAHFMLSSSSNEQDYALAVRQADIDLFGGVDLAAIDAALTDHGLCTAAGACVSGMWRVLYFTPPSVNQHSCTSYVEQIESGAGPNGLDGTITCTTARDGTLTSAHINQSATPKTLQTTMQFTSPLFAASSFGNISSTNSSIEGSWDCIPSCPGSSGDFLATRLRRTASNFIYAASGGTITTANGDQLTIQPGSMSQNATIVIEMEPAINVPDGVRIISRAYRLSPDGTHFSQPATMVFRFDPADVEGLLDPSQLRVVRWNGSEWELIGGQVDLDAGTLTVQVWGFSEYALFDCVTGLVNTDGDALGDACDVDDDEDGCTDVEELGGDPALGGARDPLNPLDFPDLDDDLTISILDLSVEAANFLQPAKPPALDLDSDGTITVLDLAQMADQFLHSCSAPP